MSDFTIDQQIAEVRRELGLRPRVYERWVRDGKLTQAQADERIGRLQAALATLERVRDDCAPKPLSLFGDGDKKAPGLF